MPAFLVDTHHCKKDGICVSVCPAAALRLNDDKLPENTPEGAARCISCGQCIAFCPHGACSLEGVAAADTPAPNFAKRPPEEQLTAFLLSRRSIRQYRKEPVPQSTIDAIMDGVRYAPSAANTQPLRWILINSRENLKKVGDLVAQGMEALAHGVGCCWAGYFTAIGAKYAPLQNFLGVEEHEVIVGGQFFGISKLRPHALPPRKEINLTIR